MFFVDFFVDFFLPSSLGRQDVQDFSRREERLFDHGLSACRSLFSFEPSKKELLFVFFLFVFLYTFLFLQMKRHVMPETDARFLTSVLVTALVR